MPDRRRRRRMDAETRRSQIAEAAASVLEGRDAHEITFDEVAEVAGVSRALVYNYYRDKGELVAAIYLRSLEQLDAAVLSAWDGEVLHPERIPVMVRTWLKFAAENRHAFRTLVDTETMHHPTVRSARRDRRDRLAQVWGRSGTDRLRATAVIGLLEQATVEWLEDCQAVDGPAEVDLDEVADMLVSVLLDGLPEPQRNR